MKLIVYIIFVLVVSSQSQSSAGSNIQKLNFQKVKIAITETPAVDVKGPTSMIETFVNQKKVDQIIFKDIEGVGGLAGVKPLKVQPIKEVFIIEKNGDYDTRFLLITGNGKILNVPAGDTYRDKKYIYFLRVDRGGAKTTDKLKLNLKTLKTEVYNDDFPPSLKSSQAWDYANKKWIPAEKYIIVDDSMDKSLPIKDYIKLKAKK